MDLIAAPRGWTAEQMETVRQLYCDEGLSTRIVGRRIGKPSTKHSIDRIDNDKGYQPGNCRWATAREQRLNQRPVTSRRDAQVARADG